MTLSVIESDRCRCRHCHRRLIDVPSLSAYLIDSVPTLKEYLDYVRLASGDEIMDLLSDSIDVNKLPRTYLDEPMMVAVSQSRRTLNFVDGQLALLITQAY